MGVQHLAVKPSIKLTGILSWENYRNSLTAQGSLSYPFGGSGGHGVASHRAWSCPTRPLHPRRPISQALGEGGCTPRRWGPREQGEGTPGVHSSPDAGGSEEVARAWDVPEPRGPASRTGGLMGSSPGGGHRPEASPRPSRPGPLRHGLLGRGRRGSRPPRAPTALFVRAARGRTRAPSPAFRPRLPRPPPTHRGTAGGTESARADAGTRARAPLAPAGRPPRARARSQRQARRERARAQERASTRAGAAPAPPPALASELADCAAGRSRAGRRRRRREATARGGLPRPLRLAGSSRPRPAEFPPPPPPLPFFFFLPFPEGAGRRHPPAGARHCSAASDFQCSSLPGRSLRGFFSALPPGPPPPAASISLRKGLLLSPSPTA
ncbi:basic salivary proline-rich protein 1-like [Sorex fumeus]|uniref:basic salivary proline-rich protein 1-like n=1 Tax=Sorex fumeus TaxID=62283 RepID=UPI0024AD2A3D|nr:basic salivary proline-rich protein 1-like [Sorex fumeus]